MKIKRSRLDWALEALALAALIAAYSIAARYWNHIHTPVYRFRPAGVFLPWTAKSGLQILLLINTGTYALLTFAGAYQKIINVPLEIDRDAPQVKQLLMRMMIVLKAIVMVLSLYLIWATVNVGLGHGRSLPGTYLVVFALLVALPLILYTGKLRQYRK